MENNPFSQDDSNYERDDSRGDLNAYQIRQKNDYETDGTDKDFTAAAIAARSGNIALEGFLDKNFDESEENPDNE